MHARTRAAVYCCLYYRGSNNSLSVNYFYSLVIAFTYLSLSVGVGYGLKLEYSCFEWFVKYTFNNRNYNID